MGDVLFMAAVGATLVFAALGVVWLAITILVRVTRTAAGPSAEPVFRAPVDTGGTVARPVPTGEPVPDEAAVRARTAAIAVAVAIARWQADVTAAGSADVSPWQAAMRARRLQQTTPRGR